MDQGCGGCEDHNALEVPRANTHLGMVAIAEFMADRLKTAA